MYKILVVDDKSLIRSALIKKIKWEELGAEFAGEAENGTDALKLVKLQLPDIVITDIRMPEMDGLELIRKINENHPGTKTIIISGYDDFNYAKQAIKYGSIEYILKPINASELNDSIRKAIELISKERQLGSKNNINSELQDQLNKLIHCTDIKLGKGSLHGQLLPYEEYLYCIALFRKKSGVLNESEIRTIIDGCVYDNVFIINDYKESIVIFGTRQLMNCARFEENIYKCIKENFIRERKDNTYENLFISIGKEVQGLYGISESYDAASRIITYCILQEIPVVRYTELLNRKSINIPLEEYESDLIINITSGNITNVHAILGRLVKNTVDVKEISVDSIRMLLSNLCHILLKFDTDIAEDIQDFIKKLNTQEYFLSFDSIENVKRILFNLFDFVTKKFIKEDTGNDSLIIKIKDFISMNYAYEINLEDISKLFHMNASYLSNLFKKKTGENINEFITNVRIANAKRLLKTDGIKIPQLAQMVGYADYAYFHKVFKKVTGMTPKEYQLHEAQ